MSNIHLIIAHPKPNSFNYAMKEVALNTLGKKHTFIISDIYEMFRLNHPAVAPFGQKRSAADQKLIKEEQDKISASELTIIQFPLYWFSFPGLLKNYWDQVLEPGFAYPGKFTNSPLNNGRKVLLSTTTQSTEQDFSQKGCNGPIKSILYPLTVAFRFVGFNILEPFVVYNIHGDELDYPKNQLVLYKKSLLKIFNSKNIWLTI